MSANNESSYADGADHANCSGGSEQDLSDLVAGYVDRLNSGESLTPEDILDEHPELGLDILTQVEAFMGLGVPVPGAPPLGTLGDYTLRRQIGRGGMGVVYEAWQGSLDRQVALKVLPAGIAADNRAFVRHRRRSENPRPATATAMAIQVTSCADIAHENVTTVTGRRRSPRPRRV